LGLGERQFWAKTGFFSTLLETAQKPSLFSRGNLSTAADSIQDRQHGHPLGAVLDWQREEIARCVTSTVGV